MKTDISIHFIIKGQSIEELDQKLTKFFVQNRDKLPFDFSERTYPRSVLHHCFIPQHILEEKGISTEVYELLDGLAETQVYWYGSSNYYNSEGPALSWDRMLMLENLKKLNGLAVFLGELKEGVLLEFNLATEIGVDILHIP